MTDVSNEELVKDGLLLLDRSLSHFMAVQGCEKSSAISKIIHGAIILAETIYAIKK